MVPEVIAKADRIPLAQFVDVNSDGMADMVFYFDKSIFVFYNQKQCKQFDAYSLDTQQNLCLSQAEVDANVGEIFSNAANLTLDQIMNGGT